jgi:hypothetical protein
MAGRRVSVNAVPPDQAESCFQMILRSMAYNYPNSAAVMHRNLACSSLISDPDNKCGLSGERN